MSQRSEHSMNGDTRGLGASAGPAPMLAFVVVPTADGVHIVPAGGGADGEWSGAPLDVDLLAAILEQTALALRGGSTSPIATVMPTLAPAPAATTSGERLRIGQLEIVPEARLVLRRGDPVPLSRIEFDLFLALVRRDGRPATRLELVREVWGFGAAVTSRSVDTQIYNLRHKLEENPANPRHLLTVSGVGYRVAT